MRKFIVFFLLIISTVSFAQKIKTIEFNKDYHNVRVGKSSDLAYWLNFEKGRLYKVSVLQQGIDVELILRDNNNKQILQKDSPNGVNGFETFEYFSNGNNTFKLIIKRVEEPGNPNGGKVSINVKKFSDSEYKLHEKIRHELEVENNKNVQTLDIDHFWQAFDNLKNCKTHLDSVESFQTLYLDRATNGLLDFMRIRNLTAEKFVTAVSRYPKFYNSVRKNTYEVKKAVPLINNIYSKFSKIYSNFKPFKVCFAIGVLSSGGTVSNNFVLIGTEIGTSTEDVDLSEFKNNALSKVLASGKNVVQKIKDIVAHECVHTQQSPTLDKNAIGCNLLYIVLREGIADYIGEMLAGGQINEVAHKYGDKHEKELWAEFKAEMCKDDTKDWLYNYSDSKDRPADLGYYIGYKIAQSYYQNATDKKKAIADIIQMNNPLRFLELSRYDQKKK